MRRLPDPNPDPERERLIDAILAHHEAAGWNPVMLRIRADALDYAPLGELRREARRFHVDVKGA